MSDGSFSVEESTAQIMALLRSGKILIRYCVTYTRGGSENGVQHLAHCYGMKNRRLIGKTSGRWFNPGHSRDFDCFAGCPKSMDSLVRAWSERDGAPWCKPDQFVGIVKIENKPTFERPAHHPQFRFLHGYLLSEHFAEYERLRADREERYLAPDFQDAILTRFHSFYEKIALTEWERMVP